MRLPSRTTLYELAANLPHLSKAERSEALSSLNALEICRSHGRFPRTSRVRLVRELAESARRNAETAEYLGEATSPASYDPEY